MSSPSQFIEIVKIPIKFMSLFVLSKHLFFVLSSFIQARFILTTSNKASYSISSYNVPVQYLHSNYHIAYQYIHSSYNAPVQYLQSRYFCSRPILTFNLLCYCPPIHAKCRNATPYNFIKNH